MTSPATMNQSQPAQGNSDIPTVRVSILTSTVQMDVDVAYTLPLSEVMPALLRMFNNVLEAKGRTPLTGDKEAELWTLGRIGFGPINWKESLRSAGVQDGDLLIMQTATRKHSPAMFDDVIDAVANLHKDTKTSWERIDAQKLALYSSVPISVCIALALIAQPFSNHYISAALGCIVSIAFMVSGCIQARFYKKPVVATGLLLSSYPVLGAGVALLCEPHIGAIGIAAALASIFIASIVLPSIALSGAFLHVIVAIPALIGAIGATIAIFSPGYVPGIAAMCAGIGVIAVSAAPRVALMLAKIPLPRIPTLGESLLPTQSQEHQTLEEVGAIGSIVLPQASALTRRSESAYQYLNGILCGATLTTVISTIITVFASPHNDIRAIIFALVIASALALRGRGLTDRTQAAVMITAGLITATVSLVLLAYEDSGIYAYIVIAALCLIPVVSLLTGLIGSRTTASPLTQRTVEIIGYILLATIVPLIFWIANIYSLARHR